MSSDHDVMRLPDPPSPAPDARAAAVQQALLRFDQKSAENGQGLPNDIRLIERTAAPLRPSRERFVMNQVHHEKDRGKGAQRPVTGRDQGVP